MCAIISDVEFNALITIWQINHAIASQRAQLILKSKSSPQTRATISKNKIHIVSKRLMFGSKSSFTWYANPTHPTRINKMETRITGIGRFFISCESIYILFSIIH